MEYVIFRSNPLTGQDVDKMRIERLLLMAVDGGLAGCILIVPLVMGGRIALGQLVLVVLSFLAAVCWCLRQSLVREARWVRSPAEVLLFLTLAFVIFQLIHLPAALVGTLSPCLGEILPLCGGAGAKACSLGAWDKLSLNPGAGREGFVVLTAFALLFLTALQRMRHIEDIERILRCIAITTVGLAVFALLQYLTSNGKYFWFYEHPFAHTREQVLGSFTNRNHFAQFMALGLGPTIWWSLGALRGDGRRNPVDIGIRFTGLALVVFAGLLSLSRGGALSMFVAVAVCLLILRHGALVGRKTMIALAGSSLLVAACLGIYGSDLLESRIEHSMSVEGVDGGWNRVALWKTNFSAACDFPLAGSGLGSHVEVFPMYHVDGRTMQNLEYSHAENGYAQVAMEGGATGLLLALSAVGLCVYWCIRPLMLEVPPRSLLCLAAVSGGLAANLVHSLVDFVWYIPGCMVGVVLMSASACRLWQSTRERESETAGSLRISRFAWVASAVCLLGLGCFMIQDQMRSLYAQRHWHRFLALKRGQHPPDKTPNREVLESMAAELSSAVQWRPDHARAQCRLAGIHLSLFESRSESEVCQMGVHQVREAALASRFESSDALKDWLSRAFGDRSEHLFLAWTHARRAIGQCPLQAEAYLYLAELCFLEGRDSPGKDAYLAQALKVRPLDASVAYEVGLEALLDGDVQRACAHWKTSFRYSRAYQQRLLELLSARVPAAFIIETFNPDEKALELTAKEYRRANRPEEYKFVLARCTTVYERRARVSQGNQAAGLWLKAASAHQALGDSQQRLRCLQNAAEADPNCYAARYTLGRCHFALQDYNEAGKHLKWCLRRRPYDAALRAEAESAVNNRLRLTSCNLGK